MNRHPMLPCFWDVLISTTGKDKTTFHLLYSLHEQVMVLQMIQDKKELPSWRANCALWEDCRHSADIQPCKSYTLKWKMGKWKWKITSFFLLGNKFLYSKIRKTVQKNIMILVFIRSIKGEKNYNSSSLSRKWMQNFPFGLLQRFHGIGQDRESCYTYFGTDKTGNREAA